MDANTDEVRAYANLPCEVPDALLTLHLAIAGRDLRLATGIAAPNTQLIDPLTSLPLPCAVHWTEAHIVKTIHSVLPYLHTFVLSGAAKAARLIGADNSVEFRFHTTDEVAAMQDKLESRFQELVARITCEGEPKTEPAGSIIMMAI